MLNSNQQKNIVFFNAGRFTEGTYKENARKIIDEKLPNDIDKIFIVTFFSSGTWKMIVQKYANSKYASYILFGYGSESIIFDRKQDDQWI